MGDTGNGGRWYALFVENGREEQIRGQLLLSLKEKEIQAIIPKRYIRMKKQDIWEYRAKKLLPGCILLNGNMTEEEFGILKEIPGILKLGEDKKKVKEIDGQELEVILSLLRLGETIGSSYVQIGDNGLLTVIDGPLVGLEDLITSIDETKGRARVSFNLFGKVKSVELGISILKLL